MINKVITCEIDHQLKKEVSLYSKLLVRSQAVKLLDTHNEKIAFGKNEYGKPYLIGHPDFHFNISHTNNMIAVAISDYPVGVDIEEIRNTDLRIAQRIFTADEYQYIVGMDNSYESADRRFYEIWTRKEAYVKWVGDGLSIPLNSFSVFDEKIAARTTIVALPKYIISVCTESGIPLTLHHDRISDIQNVWN